MKKRITLLLVLVLMLATANAQKKQIAYLSGGSNAASDSIYSKLSRVTDFVVTKVDSKAQPANYDAYDLIIASENVNGSGDIPGLKGYNKPFIMMKIIAYNSSANKWYWFASTDYGTDVSGITNIVVSNKTHPIFTGLTFTGSNSDEIQLLSTAHASGGLSWVPTDKLIVSGGAVSNLASIKGSSTNINIFEIPVGTTVTDKQATPASVVINNKWVQIGISSWSSQYITDDGMKIMKNACYYVMGMAIPGPSPVLVTGVTVTGAAGATTIATASGTLQMSTSLLPVNATDKTVTWSVNDATIGSISTSGLLTAVKNGTVTVKATANDGSGIIGTLAVIISNQTASPVSVTGITVTGVAGATSITTASGTLQMSAAVLPANATDKTVTWSVNDATIGSISTNGLLTAVKNGTVTVKATAKDGSGIFGTLPIIVSNQIGTRVADINAKGVAISPNPVSDILTISNVPLLKQIEIVNLQGQVVKTISITSDIIKEDVSDLHPGLYIVRGGNGFIGKFVKK